MAAHTLPTPAHKNRLSIILAITIVVAFLGMMMWWISNHQAPAQLSACAGDWRLCASDKELANTWGGMTHAQLECERAANAKAKYGEPKWATWLDNFGSYMRKDASFVSEGKAILVDKDVQFQNRFGAMAHVRVECSYDLVNGQVSDVSISERD